MASERTDMVAALARYRAIAAAKERAVAAAVALRQFYGDTWGHTVVGLDRADDMNAAWLEFYAAVDALAALTEGSDVHTG